MKHNDENRDWTPQEEPAPEQQPEQPRKAEKREQRRQSMLALRAVLAAYLVYLGYDLIKKTIQSEPTLGAKQYLYIILGVIFAVGGVYVLYDCWKTKKRREAEERELQREKLREEAERRGLLDENDSQQDGEDGWSYQPESEPQQTDEAEAEPITSWDEPSDKETK